MTPLTSLNSKYIDRPILTEQKTVVYSPPTKVESEQYHLQQLKTCVSKYPTCGATGIKTFKFKSLRQKGACYFQDRVRSNLVALEQISSSRTSISCSTSELA